MLNCWYGSCWLVADRNLDVNDCWQGRVDCVNDMCFEPNWSRQRRDCWIREMGFVPSVDVRSWLFTTHNTKLRANDVRICRTVALLVSLVGVTDKTR